MSRLNTEGNVPNALYDAKDLDQAVQFTVGRASTTWEDIENAGIFLSDKALAIADDLIAWVEKYYTPNVEELRRLRSSLSEHQRTLNYEE